MAGEATDYARTINAALVELELYPQVAVALTTDRDGYPYLLLFLGGDPGVYAPPATLAEIASTWRPAVPMTAPDIWNAFAPYHAAKKLVHETAPGVWALGCGHCRVVRRRRACPFGA